MDLRTSQVLLLGIFTVLLMNEGDRVLTLKLVRFCKVCDYFDGYRCVTTMTHCWKFNVLTYNRSCTTDHFYFSDRLTGRYLYRYTKLSCDPCDAGMTQLFHDLLKETHCCNNKDFCNLPERNPDIQRKYREKIPGDDEEEESEDRVMLT